MRAVLNKENRCQRQVLSISDLVQIQQSRDDYGNNFTPHVLFDPRSRAICIAKLPQIFRNAAGASHVFTSSGAIEILLTMASTGRSRLC
jgi:hypothetical protein